MNNETIQCIGCGATLQNQDSQKSGYLPASAYAKIEKAIENDEEVEVYCQRCFKLRHYNEIMPVQENADDFLRLLNHLLETDALVLNVIDLFDFQGSMISSLPRFVGDTPIIMIGNKIDLFPKNTNLRKVKDWVRQQANKWGIYPEEILLTSGKKQKNVDELIDLIKKKQQNRDIYVVGSTNVGKSTLINSIIKTLSGVEDLITTSRFPGTTLDKIEIPLDDGTSLIDTPGIIQKDQIAHILSPKDLKLVAPQKPIKPKVYQLNPGQTLFLSGLGRFDYVDGPGKQSFVVYASDDLYIHRTKTENADAFYEKHVGELLAPPQTEQLDQLKPLKGLSYHTKEKSDVLFGGLGWITVNDDVQVKTFSPGALGLGIRRAII
ncbi:ribosome biogenesis GTPase YqeH [Holzapfeliella sp. JNUCC 80]